MRKIRLKKFVEDNNKILPDLLAKQIIYSCLQLQTSTQNDESILYTILLFDTYDMY